MIIDAALFLAIRGIVNYYIPNNLAAALSNS